MRISIIFVLPTKLYWNIAFLDTDIKISITALSIAVITALIAANPFISNESLVVEFLWQIRVEIQLIYVYGLSNKSRLETMNVFKMDRISFFFFCVLVSVSAPLIKYTTNRFSIRENAEHTAFTICSKVWCDLVQRTTKKKIEKQSVLPTGSNLVRRFRIFPFQLFHNISPTQYAKLMIDDAGVYSLSKRRGIFFYSNTDTS